MNLNLRLVCIVVVAFLIGLVACKKEKQTKPQPDNSNVYIIVNNRDSAFYWNNGLTTPLPGYPAVASAIAISASDIYISGSIQKNNFYRAAYWKDGVASFLPGVDTTLNTSVTGISISNNNVFMGGVTRETVPTSSVWENGIANNLQSNPITGVVSAIDVSGNDIYTAGVDMVNGITTATYWKNGSKVHLTANITSYATSIFVAGNDVYVSGYYISSGQAPAIPAYWKNGVLTSLSTSWGMANSIFVQGNDIYVCGVNVIGDNKYATVWKNGNPTYLTSGINWSIGNSIYVLNGDVYVAGVIQDPTFDTTTATYWRNGAETIIGPAGSAANSIFVK